MMFKSNLNDISNSQILILHEQFFNNSYFSLNRLLQKLDELEAEEEKLMEAGYYDDKNETPTEETKQIKKLAKK